MSGPGRALRGDGVIDLLSLVVGVALPQSKNYSAYIVYYSVTHIAWY